jgi:uncharacterized membrane protein
MAIWPTVFAPVKTLRGFITVPGLISLAGVLVAMAMLWLDHQPIVENLIYGLIPVPLSPDAARGLLSAIAGSAMASLSLVYSTVLVVFTLAAGNIGPRLLQRFSQDSVSQVAVGILGATFLFSLIVLRAVSDAAVPHLSVTCALLLACFCVVLLLLFVNTAAKRVTIDEEIASIAETLESELRAAAQGADGLDPGAVVRPNQPDHVVLSTSSGYINTVGYEPLVSVMQDHDLSLDLLVRPGDYVLAGQPLAVLIGRQAERAERAVLRHVLIGRSRMPNGDLRFSVNLLVEIALRALSPGVNDTFTAIACADRLSSSLFEARAKGLIRGVWSDSGGAPRVVGPQAGIGELIDGAFSPLRRASATNILMMEHLIYALGRLGRGEGLSGEEAVRDQLELIRAEVANASVSAVDRRRMQRLIDSVLSDEVGRPLAEWRTPLSEGSDPALLEL